MTPFKARYPGRCGICKMRVRRGDQVVSIPSVGIKTWVPYDYEKQSGGWERVIRTTIAHLSCHRMIEGKDVDYDD